RALLEDAKDHLGLNATIPFNGRVRVFHGAQDESIPFEHVRRTIDAINSRDIVVSLSKSGDHRLSTPADLARLRAAVAELSAL
ncbi:MAG: alpha/beta hydrolase, partial [Alphaproteobacteria bacterium]